MGLALGRIASHRDSLMASIKTTENNSYEATGEITNETTTEEVVKIIIQNASNMSTDMYHSLYFNTSSKG